MRALEFVRENKQATAQQVLSYVNQTHHKPLTSDLVDAVSSYPRWELRQVPLQNLYIPDQDYEDSEQEPPRDPYGRAMAVDPDHANEYSTQVVDKRPIVIDDQGYIIDGNHRAWAAAELLNRDSIPAWVPVKHSMAEGLSQNQGQVRQTLNAWMNQDQQYEDPTQRAGFQAKVWPYIQKNIQSILSDKGADGKGSYPAAPYAAWLLVQHMDAYPQNQGKFLQQLEQSGLDPTDGDGKNIGKLQFLRDRYEVNKWIAANANNKEYYVNNKPLPNPTVNVRNPAIFKDAGQVATSRKDALDNAIAAGNKLLVAAVQATKAQTQPSFKQGVAENFADGKVKGKSRPGRVKRSGASCNGSVTDLRARAKRASGEKAKMYHWCANMKSGKKK
jgi:hypothetical protein